MPMTASSRITERMPGLIAADGKSGTASLMKPNVPNLSMMLARTTEPAVGASTWASGNQVWNGNIGTLTANARKKAPNSHFAASHGRPMIEVLGATHREGSPRRLPEVDLRHLAAPCAVAELFVRVWDAPPTNPPMRSEVIRALAMSGGYVSAAWLDGRVVEHLEGGELTVTIWAGERSETRLKVVA